MAKSSTTGGDLPIDPTANVIQLVKHGLKRQDDLRTLEAKYSRKLAKAEAKRIDALTLAESRRIDARLAAQENAVLLAAKEAAATTATLAQQVLTSAEALRVQAAAQTAATTAAIKVIEEKQYQAGGRDQQRSEGRQANQWAFGLAVAVAASVFSGVFVYLATHIK